VKIIAFLLIKVCVVTFLSCKY